MVLTLDGNSDHNLHEEKHDISEEKNQICDCFRSKPMPQTNNRDHSARAHLFRSYNLICTIGKSV